MTTQKLVVGALVAAVLVAMACSESFPSLSAKAPAKQFLVATLVPASEVPPASGVSSVGTSEITVLDTNRIRVETRISTIDSVTQSHIHLGDATVAGPVKVWLLSLTAAGRAPVTGTDKTMSVVEITRATPTCGANGTPTPCFQGGASQWTLDSVFAHLRDGTSYVNVHTRKFPGGEIRGQIVPKT